MLELTGGIALGMDIGDLLELQRAFKGDRVVHTAPEEECVLLVGEGFCPFAYLRLQVECVLHAAWQVA